MSQNISLLGAVYSAVPGVLLPKQGGGTALFTDVTPTTAVASDVAQGKIFFDATGTQKTGTASGGGGGGPTLLGTLSMGTISTESTTATDTGKSIIVKGVYDYDLLIYECSVDTRTNGRHLATVRLGVLTGTVNVARKQSASWANTVWNAKLSVAGVATTRSSTTACGIYPYNCILSDGDAGDNGQATIAIYQRYNSTQTGTINGSYTMRVYGVSFYDVIGG